MIGKEENKSPENKKEPKRNKKINKRLMLFILSAILLIILIVLGVNLILKNVEYKKYEKYEEKMNSYGFNKLYDNGSSKTSEKVSVSEAIKMAIGVCLNRYDISGIASEPTSNYNNAIWVLYAQDMALANASEVNEQTANKKVKYIDVIEYFTNAKKVLLKKELTNDESKTVKDIAKYNGIEQEAIIDMLSNDILQALNSNKLNGNKKVFKGKVNEIVVNYVEKYNLLATENEKMQLDSSKIPSNASEYAYISDKVAKEAYELEFKKDGLDNIKNPKTVYTELKNDWNQMVSKVEKYYKTLLNVNYNDITVEKLKNDLHHLTLISATDESLTEYVNYVKANNIIIEGEAKVQEPIIYYDGLRYRVRTKLDFKVVSSNTDRNLLYIDFVNGGSKYSKKDYSFYADVMMGSVYGESKTLYLKDSKWFEIIANKEDVGISL